MKYFLAILAIIGEYLVYAAIGVAMGWKHGGGAIVLALLIALFGVTWRAITKKGDNNSNNEDQELQP